MQVQRLAGAIALAAATLAAAAAHAQTYPTKPIRLVISQTTGGNADFVARQFGQRLSERLGQPVVADNRPGGAGVIGSETVARASPDGYTLLLAPTSFGINPAIHAKLPYDPQRDFAPISLLAASSAVVVVSPQIQARTVGELVALAKAQPGKLHFGSSGIASSNHLAGELFRHMAGIETVHVPYKGAPPALADLLGGRIQFMFASPPSVMALVRNGKLRAIATTGTRRAAQLPDLPTVAESGVPGYQSTVWQALLAPARTPAPIIKRLHEEVADIARQPELKERLIVDGSEAIGSTPRELADHIADEIARWTKVIKAIGLKL
jgi:tripartite-type tricarboxylate transporter receptor subunit TctC